MRWRVCFVSLGALTCALSPAASHAQSPASKDTIVVTGQSLEEAKRKAQVYVSQLGVAVGEHPAARWFDPVCPHALGLSKEHAALVEEQIREIGREVGAPLAKPGCRANFAIVFTDGSDRVVQKIVSAGTELSPTSVRALKESKAPIRWWYNSEFRSRDGSSAGDVPSPFAQVTTGLPTNYVPLNSGRSGNLTQYSSSVISTQAVRAIRSATVVIDVKRAEGVPLKAVVDYSALVGLSEIVLGASPPDSILALFPSGADREFTHSDRAFLTGLYRIAMDRKAERQRHAIVEAMVNPKARN